MKIIKKISIKLKTDLNFLYDLAGNSKKMLPPDIISYLENNPKVISLIRSAKNYKLKDEEFEKIEKIINNSKTKCLIVAAGIGSRLKSHTEHIPKCMLDFGGKTLLQRQLLSYKDNGIDDISVIRGYKKNKINYKGIKYFYNDDYKNNNILNSIFYAEDVINGNIIISYSDILFEPFVVKRAMDSDHDISVLVDVDWREYYIDRKDHPLSEAENVIFDSNNKVVKIGKISSGKDEVHGEFIGMIKLNHRGCEIIKQNFSQIKKIILEQTLSKSKNFSKGLFN